VSEDDLACVTLLFVSDGQRFGTLLRELRRAAGLTQEQLSNRAQVGVRTLRDLETGRSSRPQKSTVELLAKALGLDEGAREAFVAASRRGAPPSLPTADR
jgi:transcriptional regulator with XRE-family HTH domain